MPFFRERYPRCWEAFSLDIRTNRAQGQCECTGIELITGLPLCGLHCTHPGPRRCVEVNHTPAVWARGRVILTVAHICHLFTGKLCEPLCADPFHCIAACQRCHTRIDSTLHALHAAETRRARKEAAGQLTFLA